MQNQDEQLLQLIREVLEHPDASQQQRQAMDKLLKLIPKLSGIYRHSDQQINCKDALNQALMGVSLYQGSVSGQNIRRFVQKRKLDINNAPAPLVQVAFLKWFNQILKNKITDQYRLLKKQPLSFDAPINSEEAKTTFAEKFDDPKTLGDLGAWSQRQEMETTRLKGYILELYIEQDPDGKLRNCYHKDSSGNECRECNCQFLFQKLYLTPETEQKIRIPDIARQFNVAQATLYTRLLPKCRQILRQIQQEIETNLDKYASKFLGTQP